MSKRFHRGLVVGKFSPLHRGHESVIRRAFDQCDEVVILSYAKPELAGCDANRREQWLAALFPDARRLVVTDERLQECSQPGTGPREIPTDDADETVHRRFCGFLCRHILGVTVDAVFTSEDYGEGFAEELSSYFGARDPGANRVRHVLVDRERRVFPVSATWLRSDIHAHREWLSPVVYASFVRRVCLLGGESSGKSELTEALALHFGTVHVAEFGRELWSAKAGALAFEDMREIAEVQVAREEQAAQRARRFLFCDTSPLTTLFYSRHLFGKADPALEGLAERGYDLTVLCAPDFPFVQDGTRQHESFRVLQHGWFQRELARRGIRHLLVTGSTAERVSQIQEALGN